MRTETPPIELRRYDDRDEDAVIGLLNRALGGGPAGRRPATFFRWKHFDNPFGRSFMLVAESGGRVVGLRAFLRWEFASGDRTVRAVRAVDTATDPEFQGRGIFSRLTTHAIELLADDADIIFNTPNEKSLPGYLKMGWSVVARLPVHLRLCRPLSMASHALGRSPALLPLTDADDAVALVDAVPAVTTDDDRLTTVRTPAYLRWRYGPASGLGYRAVGTPDAFAIFRVRPRGRLMEATVSEIHAGSVREARELFRAVAKSSGADHLAAHFAQGSVARRAVRRSGFVPAPRGLTFVARPLRDGVAPDPLRERSWALSTGDLEVF